METDPARTALTVIRVVVAILIFIHGSARLISGGVDDFGGWLSSLGFPLGFVIAGAITAMEIAGTPILASGRLVRPLSLYYAAELTMGILLVHRVEGWFVVGLGRNGMEYSVLLVSVFLTLAWAAGEKRGSA